MMWTQTQKHVGDRQDWKLNKSFINQEEQTPKHKVPTKKNKVQLSKNKRNKGGIHKEEHRTN